MKDKELKKRWVEALRSGRYRQTTCQLRFTDIESPEPDDGYCCLGVLADLIDPRGWVYEDQDWSWNQQQEILPDHYIELLKLSLPFKKYADKNDLDCLTFEEIADYIEANE